MTALGRLIEIVVDGGSGLGFGHLSRMRTLSQTLKAGGFGITWAPQSDVARTALQAFGVRSDAGAPGLSIIDLPYDGTRFVEAAAAAGRRTLAFDYAGSAPADIVLRTNAPLKPVSAARLHYGLDWALIRAEVQALDATAGDYVLVVIGGSDHGDRGPLAAARLAEAGLKVVLVRGPLAGPLGDLPDRVELRQAPADFPDLLAGCRWAVANAGTTLMELMYLGKAVHALPQTPEESRFAEALLDQHAVLGVGLESLDDAGHERVEAVGRMASSLVDGRGAERIMALCESLIHVRVTGP